MAVIVSAPDGSVFDMSLYHHLKTVYGKSHVRKGHENAFGAMLEVTIDNADGEKVKRHLPETYQVLEYEPPPQEKPRSDKPERRHFSGTKGNRADADKMESVASELVGRSRLRAHQSINWLASLADKQVFVMPALVAIISACTVSIYFSVKKEFKDFVPMKDRQENFAQELENEVQGKVAQKKPLKKAEEVVERRESLALEPR